MLYSLEQLSAGDSPIHRLHPAVKLAVTGVYLLCVISLERSSLTRLAPYLFYPAVLMALADIPWRMILQRAAVALPFCLFAGVSSLVFDQAPALTLGGHVISEGVLSLLMLIFRTLLCVGAVLILVSVTPFSQLTAQLRRFHVPNLLVLLLEMVYRYISVLGEEAVSMVTAFRLRGNGARWPSPGQFGPFVGQLLLRSADRAERVYQAMQCRCYALGSARSMPQPWHIADGVFLLLGGGSAFLFRFFDLTVPLGGLLPW